MEFSEIMKRGSTINTGALKHLITLIRNLETSTKNTLSKLSKTDAEDEVATNALLKLKNKELKELLSLKAD